MCNNVSELIRRRTSGLSSKAGNAQARIIKMIIAFIIFVIFSMDLEAPERNCRVKCETFNAEFVGVDVGSAFKNGECWCKKDGAPLQVG